MKIYLLTIIFFFVSVFAEAETIDPQFAIDVLTGKTAVAAKPCSGPPGSGCENIVPQMSVERREDLEIRHAKPEPQMTPANPIEYARQQIPRYSRYPAEMYQSTWGYAIQPFPVRQWQSQRNPYQEVAMIYNFKESTAEYNRRKTIEIAARQAAEETQTIEKTIMQEVTPIPTTTPQEPQKQVFSVSASAHSLPISLATRSLKIPSWFYKVLGLLVFGFIVTIIIVRTIREFFIV